MISNKFYKDFPWKYCLMMVLYVYFTMKKYLGWLVWDEGKVLKQKMKCVLALMESQPSGIGSWKALKILNCLIC